MSLRCKYSIICSYISAYSCILSLCCAMLITSGYLPALRRKGTAREALELGEFARNHFLSVLLVVAFDENLLELLAKHEGTEGIFIIDGSKAEEDFEVGLSLKGLGQKIR